MSKIYEIFGDNAHEMTMALMEAANVADMIPAGGSVALKPNLVMAGTPESGATTHPGVLSGCIEYLKAHGFDKISIIEGSWVGDRTGRAYKVAGYDAVCKKYDVPFYDLKQDKTRTVKTAIRPMEISCRAWESDFLINLPVLKGHCQTVMTCALKNCKGTLPDHEKRRFHSEGLTRPIAALAAALMPDLTIVDSICGDQKCEAGFRLLGLLCGPGSGTVLRLRCRYPVPGANCHRSGLEGQGSALHGRGQLLQKCQLLRKGLSPQRQGCGGSHQVPGKIRISVTAAGNAGQISVFCGGDFLWWNT